MPTTTITLNGSSVTLATMPLTPAPRMVEPWFENAVAIVKSPFSQTTQAQEWPGGDTWGLTVTLPPLTVAQGAAWTAWMMQMSGQSRAVQMSAPPPVTAPGVLTGSVPVVDGTVDTNNAVGSKVLSTRGWKASDFRAMLPGAVLQICYRMYRVLDVVNTDGSGKASFEVFPSLRETPADGTAIVLNNPQGLFRLGQNKNSYSYDVTRLSRVSFPLVEYL